MACKLFECPRNTLLLQEIEILLFVFAGLFVLLLGPRIIAFCLSKVFKICKRSPLKPINNDYAIITGASDGIGLEFARQLAKRGYKLFLLSRTMSKLEAVRTEIMDKYSTDVQIMAVDFTRTDIYDPIRERVKLLPGRAAVLVNNVGMMNTAGDELADIIHPDYNTRLLTCNTLSVVKMCEIVLPIMKEQKFGVVVNIGSSMGATPFPYFALYSSTKAFISYFTVALSTEYSGYGIVFQDLTPNQVNTNLSKTFENRLYGVPADSFVRYALNNIGKEFHTSAHPKHKILNNLMKFFDLWIPQTIWQGFLKMVMRDFGKNTNSAKVHP